MNLLPFSTTLQDNLRCLFSLPSPFFCSEIKIENGGYLLFLYLTDRKKYVAESLGRNFISFGFVLDFCRREKCLILLSYLIFKSSTEHFICYVFSRASSEKCLQYQKQLLMFPCPPLYHKPYYHHSHFDSSYLLHHVFTKQELTCNVGDSSGVSSNLALSLSKKRILILNKNNTSLKFGSSSTSEIFPWGEKKTTTRFFFLCSEKLRE